ncbi:MAG: tetratricopeptide repeat protein [Sideroxydans sp.]|nr:tetratricopeptide repeat protein [Sideroxydans sp.]
MRTATCSKALIAAFIVVTFVGVGTCEAIPINVQVLSATIKDKKVEDATVTLQKNGEQSAVGTTDSRGQVSLNFSSVDDASALLIIKKEGYSNLVVKCPCAGMTYAISPVMNNLDGMRAVLVWGAQPRDIDAHLLVLPQKSTDTVQKTHIFFGNKSDWWDKTQNQLLDVDNTTGYGPETITINRKLEGVRYIYSVHNFSDASKPRSDGLSKSGAKVFVYVGKTLIKTFEVPKSTGNLWTVFTVSEVGELQESGLMQSVAANTGPGSYQLEEYLMATNAPQLIKPEINFKTMHPSTSIKLDAMAESLNKEGEMAYHSGNLDESIRLYQAAIELDGNYGQAYSNLGLAFQKAGREAEAMWANRKAIALANGPTAATVRASSHFNNGKIYEAASQWSDALREYQHAKNEKTNPVYDKAIQQMLEKAGH